MAVTFPTESLAFSRFRLFQTVQEPELQRWSNITRCPNRWASLTRIFWPARQAKKWPKSTWQPMRFSRKSSRNLLLRNMRLRCILIGIVSGKCGRKGNCCIPQILVQFVLALGHATCSYQPFPESNKDTGGERHRANRWNLCWALWWVGDIGITTCAQALNFIPSGTKPSVMDSPKSCRSWCTDFANISTTPCSRRMASWHEDSSLCRLEHTLEIRVVIQPHRVIEWPPGWNRGKFWVKRHHSIRRTLNEQRLNLHLVPSRKIIHITHRDRIQSCKLST